MSSDAEIEITHLRRKLAREQARKRLYRDALIELRDVVRHVLAKGEQGKQSRQRLTDALKKAEAA